MHPCWADAVRPSILLPSGAYMQITVKLFATFRVGRFVARTLEYPAGTRIAHVIRDLQIPEGQIGMIMVNGRHAEPDQELYGGESLALFPLVGGG